MTLSAYAVTTPAAAAAYIGEAAQDRADVMEAVINAVSEGIENYTGRRFVTREISAEPHDCEGLLLLDHYPVTAISGVMLDGRSVTDYTADVKSGLLTRPGGFHGAALVTYTAGYAADAGSVPQDVQLAAWLWSAALLEAARSQKSESLGDYSVTYTEAGPLPPQAAALLEPYRTKSV